MRVAAKGKTVAANERKRPVRKRAPAAGHRLSPKARPDVDMGPLPGFIGYPLRRAQLSVFEEFDRTVGDLGLRPGQFSVLTVIDKNPGIQQSKLARTLKIKGPNLVAVINGLEKRGLAERRAADRRSYALYLSAKGQALVLRAVAALRLQEQEFDRLLGRGGRARLVGLLQKLTQP